MKRAILILAILVLISCIGLSTITEFFNSIPKPVKVCIGVCIAVYAASWAYSWVFDPIVIVVENGYGAFNFGPFIVIEPCIWHSNDVQWRNMVLNHEYTHYVQHALYGPILSLSYPILAAYSTLKTGNQWEANFWEIQASESGDSKPYWQPSFVIKF